MGAAAVDLASVTWRLNAYAAHWLSDDDLAAVTEWMADNNLDLATAEHPVVVQGGTITYGRDRSDSTVRSPHRDIVTATVPLRTVPPTVWRPDCTAAEMAALHKLFADHEWSEGFGGSCVDCSVTSVGDDGRIWCHRGDVVQWPCPPVRALLIKIGASVPPATDGHQSLRILGDCLDPDDNAKVFGRN
jgi:hypothetical protein